MGRRNARWSNNVYEIFLIGEQLRQQIHEQGLVKDRRHHLRKHKKCFIGRDVVDWLVKMHHVSSRDEAVIAMQILKQHGMFHHVTDEHEFKDHNSFYRFSFDDDTYKLKPDLSSFYWGLDIYRKVKDSNVDVMQEFYLKGSLYPQAFLGCDLVDFLLVSEGHENRDEVICRLRDLLERDIIKHVTDDYHFNDDKLIYEFNLDFDRAYLLQDVVELVSQQAQGGAGPHEADSTESGSGVSRPGSANPVSMRVSKAPSDHGTLYADVTEVSSSPNAGKDVSQPPVMFTRLTSETVNRLFKNYPLVTRASSCIQIECDVMGFGFVLGGSSPCYVQTVDPLGPAAAAGLKVRHFISSINDQDVLTMSHREVGHLLALTRQITIKVLSPSQAMNSSTIT